MARLAVIATVAGAFSGLFGVGGGAVIVPLLILWMGYEEREATGTSLTAIPAIALIGVAGQGVHRERDVARGGAIRPSAVGGGGGGGGGPQAGAPGGGVGGVQGLHGNVHVAEGIAIGIPAIGGVVAGAAIQQRVPVRVVSGAFAVLLVVSAAVLVF